jgi:hypothetical protein
VTVVQQQELYLVVMQAGATQAHDCPTSELHGYDFSVPPEHRRPKHRKELYNSTKT